MKNVIYNRLKDELENIDSANLLVIAPRRSYKTSAAIKILKDWALKYKGNYFYVLGGCNNTKSAILRDQNLKDNIKLDNGSVIKIVTTYEYLHYSIGSNINGVVIDEPSLMGNDYDKVSISCLPILSINPNTLVLVIGSITSGIGLKTLKPFKCKLHKIYDKFTLLDSMDLTNSEISKFKIICFNSLETLDEPYSDFGEKCRNDFMNLMGEKKYLKAYFPEIFLKHIKIEDGFVSE